MGQSLSKIIIFGFFTFLTIQSRASSRSADNSAHSATLYSEYRSSSGPWAKFAKTHKQKRELINSMLHWINESELGKKIIHDARKRAHQVYKKSLLDLISFSQASVTDNTVLRRFFAHAPHQVSYEFRSTIFLASDLTYAHATIDLAHELTHFTYKPLVNPYEHFDHPVDFVRKVIDGHGGEVDAFMNECQVGKELMGSGFLQQGLCKHFVNGKTQDVDRVEVLKGFYALGEYQGQFLQAIDVISRNLPSLPETVVTYFPYVSQASTILISSAYNLPYPLAALQEFQKVRANICRSEWKRISMAQRIKGNSEVNYKFRLISSDIQSKCSGLKSDSLR